MTSAFEKINNVCLIFIASFLGAVALKYTQAALIPFVFSIFAFAALRPMVNWIQTHSKVPRGASIALALILLLIGLSGIVLIIIHSVDSFISGIGQYRKSVETTLQIVERQLEAFNVDVNLETFKTYLLDLPMFTYFRTFTGQILSGLGNLFLVFIFTVFLLAGEKARSRPVSPMVNETLSKVSSYISTKLALSMATGILVWIVLFWFQVEMAFLFALLTVMLNFIPTIGSIVAIALPVPILILQFQFGWPFWTVLILTSIIQFAIGNVIEPMMMGESLDLHPITVLIGLIFWGIIWGIPGMFLAVPITAIAKIVLARIPTTQMVAEIMAGRLPSQS